MLPATPQVQSRLHTGHAGVRERGRGKVAATFVERESVPALLLDTPARHALSTFSHFLLRLDIGHHALCQPPPGWACTWPCRSLCPLCFDASRTPCTPTAKEKQPAMEKAAGAKRSRGKKAEPEEPAVEVEEAPPAKKVCEGVEHSWRWAAMLWMMGPACGCFIIARVSAGRSAAGCFLLPPAKCCELNRNSDMHFAMQAAWLCSGSVRGCWGTALVRLAWQVGMSAEHCDMDPHINHREAHA